MTSRLDEEIREVEARIERERNAMALAIDDCVEGARNAVVAPQSLLAVAAIGFMIGAASKRAAAAQPRRKKRGFTGVLIGLAGAALRARYGNPWMLVQSLLARRRDFEPRAGFAPPAQ